jgi:hypothetical protein
LQREGDFLLAVKCAAIPEDPGVNGGEALERDADSPAGDFLRELIDSETDLRGDVMRPWLEEVRRNARQYIAEAKYDLLLLLGLWI